MDELTVHYERKFSDGNYGSEGISFAITRDVRPAELTSDAFFEAAYSLRQNALEFLASSRSRTVAQAARYELEPVIPSMEAATLPEEPDDDPEAISF